MSQVKRRMLKMGAMLAGCSTAVPSTPINPETPMFVSSKSSFLWYSAHRRGETFQYLEDTDGNRFVMTHEFRGTSMLLPLMFVPVQARYGMMLDENLCSNGLAAYRAENLKSYFVNVVPSFNESIREAPPKGICFRREEG